MITEVKIDDITPASYNPRKISQDSFEDLRGSIRRLGVIKPIIVREENSTIVAGHQRTKAMKAEGIESCPAYIIKAVTTQDEIRFNQLHNMVEVGVSEVQPIIKINQDIPVGEFVEVSPENITDIIRFIDDNGFTGNFRNGRWFYQKYHTDEMIENINRKHFGEKFEIIDSGCSFQVVTSKAKMLRIIQH